MRAVALLAVLLTACVVEQTVPAGDEGTWTPGPEWMVVRPVVDREIMGEGVGLWVVEASSSGRIRGGDVVMADSGDVVVWDHPEYTLYALRVADAIAKLEAE